MERHHYWTHGTRSIFFHLSRYRLLAFHNYLLAGTFPYFILFTIRFNRFVFSSPGRLTTFCHWGQSNCLSVCGSAFDDGQAPEIVVGYLVVDSKVLLVRLNLGYLLRENCRSLHPTPSQWVNTNAVANYATTQSRFEVSQKRRDTIQVLPRRRHRYASNI